MAGFKDSSFVFTDPIRYFKENDPYYWEVDNIPLKQLQENCLWLKDQIASNPATDGIDRNELNELRPYSDGTNNIVKVKPGRFTARINDAYNKNPLQKLSLLTGENLGQFETYNNPAGASLAASIVNRLKSSVSADALSLNGLIERVLTWPVINDDQVGTTITQNSLPSIVTTAAASKWPLLNNHDLISTLIQDYGGAYELPRLSAEFIKQFRGVARTAVVDVPEELSIQIPNFDADDFFTSDGTISNASVRIDLLFVYSKPVDVSSTTIQKWSGGQPTALIKPILGLVRGAGVGVNTTTLQVSPGTDSAGNTQIMADYKDSLLATNGFQASNVHGSFPSPDDLMNIAPIISERLTETDPQLIGQTILPIAYIVVNKNSSVNALGNVVITDTNIVDIRPFFRTTELTYNERAGLAAAIPAPSLANPVTTQYVLDRESSRLKGYIDAEIARITNTEDENNGLVSPRSVGGGVIWGGLNFGPEGAINSILTTVGQTENLFTDATVPAYPDWDLADWWTFDPPADTVGQGERRGDRINFSNYDSSLLGSNNGPISQFNNKQLYTWVKKRINIDRTAVPWMADYEVRVNYKNCFPVKNYGTFSRDYANGGLGNTVADFSMFLTEGIYYEKYTDHFIIYVYLPYFSNESTVSVGTQPNYNPRENRNVESNIVAVFSEKFPYPTAGTVPDALTNNYTFSGGGLIDKKLPYIGKCMYPTISFDVIGYTNGTYHSRLPQNTTASITLR